MRIFSGQTKIATGLTIAISIGAFAITSRGGGKRSAAYKEIHHVAGITTVASGFRILKEATTDRVKMLSAATRRAISVSSEGGLIEAVGKAIVSHSDPITVATVHGHVCLVNESPVDGGAICGSSREAWDGTLVSAEFCRPALPSGYARLFGLMPNGVRNITIRPKASDKGVVTVPILSNLYEVDVAAVPTRIIGVSPKEKKISVDVPLDAYKRGSGTCA